MKKLLGKIFNNKHSIFTNTVFFTLAIMLIYVLVLLPAVVFFFIQNPNIFHEAEVEVNLNRSELYQLGSSMELYGTFITIGAFCELIRRSISMKQHIFKDMFFMSYVLISTGCLCDILGYVFMMFF